MGDVILTRNFAATARKMALARVPEVGWLTVNRLAHLKYLANPIATLLLHDVVIARRDISTAMRFAAVKLIPLPI